MLKFFAWLKKIVESIERMIPMNLLSRRAQVRRLIAMEEEQQRIEEILRVAPEKKKEKKDDLDLIIDNSKRDTTDLDQPSY